ncbi:hypothetical protein UM91_22015 [Pseudomonas oryzihabitans]|uniref:hypothetical protein n=1 Tax=Pseudomonas oryzihabitans TaxID=47885 RepID=UPI0005CA1195|nr:hypothetical protein [Pseudomonas oryzihabitans]KIZ48456.1 hypothetical protein UM91_22015 [Pseudomonas oryzihabitans]
MSTTKKTVVYVLIGLAIVYISNVIMGRVGEQEGQKVKERLTLVWPQFMAMPEMDRALLAGLAFTCRLADRPAEASQVVPCLRQGLDAEKPDLPIGLDKIQARGELDRIINNGEARQ